jgi:Tfp pilus assembly protein PilN
MRAVNLLPKDAVRVVTRTQKIAVGVGTGGAVILTALMATMFLSASSKVHDAQLTLDDLKAQLAIIPPPAASPSAGATALAAQQGPRVAAVTSALQRRVAWDRVMRELSLVLPEDVWLSKLSAKSPISPTAPTTPGTPLVAPAAGQAPTEMTIDGYTYSHDAVARLLSRLAVIPDLQNVALQSSTLTGIGKQTVVRFTIAADLRSPGVSS